ncbi:MAG: tRNA (adenosine(37)-N6)-threonylcarbamoyltransferase complex dimerization subunit type 1 TsaB, partial [Candidatus Aegiribacteria sp.]|nr:tRNA (adenosine(37)-N6)-threonylcarbamoyltransferase complex dimerization subunit type 1 TsaB [Candidatus Aegiribacteria sp.]MBD3294130.1 tRNA (adenosine(37)-N6)-threonylcarbamoyltransferase complex dimerization subunit type 1 TsaB [Candidatus Fermentibacteria bacterium]
TDVWLGIETTGSSGGAALLESGSVISRRIISEKSSLSRKLLPGISELLHEAGLPGSRIEGIAVSTGPGSFTGIRIGVSTAQGLARGWSCGIVGVSTLRVLATSADPGIPVLVSTRARKKEVFAAVYASRDISSEILVEEGIYTTAAVEARVAELGRLEAVGNGRSVLNMPGNVVLLPEEADIPSPAAVARLGGEIAVSRGYDDFVKPLYMRDFRQKADTLVP